jgi:protein involved in polysaccharide export with SLBB domain
MKTNKIWSVAGIALGACLLPGMGVQAQQSTVPQAQSPVQPQTSPHTVLVLGEVMQPGAFEVTPQESTVVHLITSAGGATGEVGARMNRGVGVPITIFRRQTGATTTVDFAKTMITAPTTIPLQNGDMVVVGQSADGILVTGRVAQQGFQPIPKTGALSVADSLALAGGMWPDGENKELVVLHREANGRFRQEAFAPNAGQPKFLEKLQPGDVVAVVKAAPQ